MNVVRAIGNAGRKVSKALHQPTVYRSGNMFLNRLGLQSVRMLLKTVQYGLKPVPRTTNYAEYKAKLDTDGIVVIENFLPQDVFNSILAEFNQARKESKGLGIRFVSSGGCDNWAAVFAKDDQRFAAVNSAIRNHPVIAELVGHICKTPVDYFPDSMSFLEQNLSEGASIAIDGTTFLHADVHYPTCKVVMYMTDVGEGDAPFVFCTGSHRMSAARLLVEKEMAISLGKLKPGEVTNLDLRIFDRTPELSQDQMQRMGLRPTPVYAPKNTLIIANHCGFHSRGEFVGGRRRVTLRMSFRFMDSPRYKLRKLLDPVYRLGRSLK
jgi:hypothetical protein